MLEVDDRDDGNLYIHIGHVEKWIREGLHMLEERGILHVRPMYLW